MTRCSRPEAIKPITAAADNPIRGAIALVCLAALGAVMGDVLLAPHVSSDLLALHLAAGSLAEGLPIYAPPELPFTMRPPEGWTARAAAIGHDAPIYPYIYPPLWAALLAALPDPPSFAFLRMSANLLNPLLLLAGSVAAWRAMRPGPPLWLFVAAGQLIAYGTVIGGVALMQNQPQILVSVLVLFTLERMRAGAEARAGAILALAAAIKLYPALYAVLWLASGNWRALGGFAAAGGGLAALSITLAGWPLHADFLSVISSISRSAIIIPLSFGLDGLVGGLLGGGTAVVAAAAPGAAGLPEWLVLEKPAPWLWATRALLVAALCGLALWAHRCAAPRRIRSVWPAAMIVLSLAGPLAWSYHFLAPALLAPGLLCASRSGSEPGPGPGGGIGAARLLALLAIFGPLSYGGLALLQMAGASMNAVAPIGALAMAGLAAGFALLPARAGGATAKGRA
ncbi:glycosyltransferase 87 family protein [Profundibacterium mesophilum]|uniref:DUF2029 domain-containing protein n=1 Tax=Profundibacterium mesophilum KAUST100406-0324 TaxID=1037889 RepID=A0A921NQ38_9RHOB|nr:glycosyltransferase 87 family protein [Profundibacterium mesophilum]KAF0676626.1 hypothetical protein PMES_01358 [Profundibacterium mesophilum KAUST100406-0324]